MTNTALKDAPASPPFFKLFEPFQPAILNFHQSFEMQWHALHKFRKKVSVRIQSHRYTIKTVESVKELKYALELRHEVFYRELLGQSSKTRLDVDQFDKECDHLIVIDNQTARVVGTYRVLSSHLSDSFYSGREFDLSFLKNLPGTKLELGRACVDQNHRNGLVLVLLWKGIYQYLREINASYLFGCSSIPLTNPYTAAALCRYFKEGGVSLDTSTVLPRENYRVRDFDIYQHYVGNLNALDLIGMQKLVPSLLLSYFKAGAKVSAEPAFDRQFACFDFLTLLDTAHIRSAYEKTMRA